MADLETRLHDALGDAGSHTHPSPDLFARVVGSIAEDRARRRRVRTIALLWVAGVALLALLTVTLTPKDEEGMHMPWWILEMATNLFTIRVDAPVYYMGDVHPDLVKVELVRIGGILLIIGVLHGLNLVIMPVLGRLFSLNRRLPPRDPRDGRYE